MFRHSAHSFVRSSCSNLPRRAVQLHVPRRYASIPPPRQKAKGKRHIVLRLGIAAAGLYWYNTSSDFAEEPAHVHSRIPHTETEDENLPTIEDIAAARKARMSAQSPLSSASTSTEEEASEAQPMPSPGDLEEEAESEGAFNPETGEINWDCPCLGGMANGPCGEEFRAAFSCFVFSKDEPKGMDCIDKFKGMQDCFRLYPEVYGDELADDGEDGEGEDVREAEQPLAPQPTPGDPSTTPASDAMSSTPAKTEEAPGQPRTSVDRAHISAQEKREPPQVMPDSQATIAPEKQT